MWMAFAMAGMLGFIVCIILLMVRLFKRKPIKKVGVAILLSIVLFFIGAIISPDTSQSENQDSSIVDDPINEVSLEANESVASNDSSIDEGETIDPATIVTYEPIIRDLEVHFIDVGQGDAILIISPTGKAMLVDGGSLNAGQNVVNYIKKAGITTLNVVVASHPNEDHIGGLISVFDSFDVERVYDTGYAHPTEVYENYLTKIDDFNIEFEIIKRGSVIDLDPSISIDVLSPYLEPQSPNAASTVLKITYQDKSVLLTADTEDFAEFNMIDSGIDLKADILQIAHHGSANSSSEAFLDAVKPTTAIISVGKDNSYGHPDNTVLKALSSRKIDVYRTDMQGDIVIKIDGSQYTMNKPVDPLTVATVNKTPSQSNIAQETKPEPVQAVSTITYIGNKNSKVFHLPSCKTLPMEKNRVYFDSREDAVDAGFKPCGNCKP